MHTLVLLGELDRASAPLLEAEIERLCGEGVVDLALDLSGLTHIDATGVAVIVYRRKWCARHGCELTMIGETSLVRGAFALAGASVRVPLMRVEEARPAVWSRRLALTPN